jgi:hypothetical protein
MFKSRTVRALTLSVLSALFVTLSGHLLPMRVFGAIASPVVQGQENVIVGESAAVLSTAHYQARHTLTCGGTTCLGQFPVPGTKRRLNVSRIYCLLSAATISATVHAASIELLNTSNTVLLDEYIQVAYSSSDGNHTFNQAVDMQVGSSQHIGVVLQLVSGTASIAVCTLTGTLDTLQ